MKRLEAVGSLIEKCNIFADIGCDHGYLSEFVAKNNLAKIIYASDISEKSLNKAKKLLKNYNIVSFYLGDGFEILPNAPDFAAICGMGGLEIIKILTKGKSIEKLVLQPQKNAKELRAALMSLGYNIIADMVVLENSKFYDIIKVEKINLNTVKSEKKSEANIGLNEYALNFGCFYKIKSEILFKRLNLEEKKLLSYKQTPLNEEKLRIVREVKKWQQ